MENEMGIKPKNIDINIGSEMKSLLNDKYTDDLKNILKVNSVVPSHTPRKFVDCFFPTSDNLYVYYNNTWNSMIQKTNFAIGSFTRNTTGTVAYDGLGFKPKLIKIKGYYLQDDSCWCDGLATEDEQFVMSIWNSSESGEDPNYVQTFTEDYILKSYNKGGAATFSAVLDSLDNDGFTLTFTLTGSPGSTRVVWEAYG